MKRVLRENWHQLTEEGRSQFLVQSRFLLSMLDIAGYNVSGATERDTLYVFSADVLDLLSKLEHDRWSRERIDEGWRFGKRDAENRRTPYLLPWEDMPEEVRNYDREVVRNLPELLSKTGYTITSMYKEPDRGSLFTLANQGVERASNPLRGSPSAHS